MLVMKQPLAKLFLGVFAFEDYFSLTTSCAWWTYEILLFHLITLKTPGTTVNTLRFWCEWQANTGDTAGLGYHKVGNINISFLSAFKVKKQQFV
jgi:hypothetical protein